MNKKALILSFVILISLVPIVLSREYFPIDCSITTGYCYMDSKDGTAILTNNPRQRNYVLIRPKDTFVPILEDDKTYLEQNGLKILKGNDFVPEKKEIGDFDKWIYNFSNSAPNLATGTYTFYATLSGMSVEAAHTFIDIIDLTPPSIDEIRLFENGIIDRSDIKIIEENSNATIKVRVNDNDGGSSDLIPDTKVKDVWICVDTPSCGTTLQKYNSGLDGFYSFNVTNIGAGQHRVYFYAEDNLTNLNNSVSYAFDVNDTLGPIINLLSPAGAVTDLEYPNLIFSTSENATCKLYRFETGELKAETTILQKQHTLSGFPIDLPSQGQTGDVTSWFNISCKDRVNNENSLKIGITYTTHLPIIEGLRSTRGNYITAYYNGGITSLETVTNTNTYCWYKGGKTPQQPPIGSTPLEKINQIPFRVNNFS